MRKSGQTNYVNYGELRKIKGVTTIIKADVAGKQNQLSNDQLAAVNSGITAQVLADLQLRLISAEEKEILDLFVYDAERHTLGIRKVDDNAIHFWTYGDVAAGGEGEGGGSGTSGTLYGCNDVTAYNNAMVGRDAAHPAQAGDILVYDGNYWHAAEAPATGVTGIKVNGGNVLTGEVGLTIPTALSQLSDDSTHRLVTDTQINSWATQSFVNSSIATATATFRGTSAAGLTESQFLSWANGLTHDNNDYVFWSTVDLAGNVQYKRYKYNGRSWVFEYTLNNSSFTSSQWATINSGFDADDHTKLDGIAEGAQVNVLESVKLNGTALSITNKAVNVNAATSISMPTGFSVGSLSSAGSIAVNFATGYYLLTAAQKAILDLLEYNADNHTLGIKKVNNNPIHFWTYGNVAAGGVGEGGGSGTSGTLYGCTDVTAYNTVVGRDSTHPAQNGDILAYDGTHWHAITPPATGVTSLGGVTGSIGLASNLTISNGVLSGNYSDATTTAHGLMSATDKSKLNNIASGATKVESSTVLGWGFVKKVCNKSADNNGNVALQLGDLDGVAQTTAFPSTSLAAGKIQYYYNLTSSLTGNMPCSNNANGLLLFNRHNGDYHSFLGLSSDGRIYYKTALSTSTSWSKVAWTSEIPTKVSQLTDDVVSGHYLPLANGTCTPDQYYPSGKWGINLNNSDIIGVNGLFYADTCNTNNEGIHFLRSNGNWDTLYAVDGTVYFAANHALDASSYSGQITMLSAAGGALTGVLKLADGIGLNGDNSGNGILVHHPTSWTGVSSTQWGVGTTDSQGVIRSNASDLQHYKGGNTYTIYDSSNLTKATLGLGNVDNTADANKTVARANYADVLRDPEYHFYSNRRPSANLNWSDAGLHYFLATSTMTTGKPMGDGAILHLSWDNGSYEGQFYIPTNNSGSLHPQWRGLNGGTWGGWTTIYDSGNANNASTPWTAQSLKIAGRSLQAANAGWYRIAKLAGGVNRHSGTIYLEKSFSNSWSSSATVQFNHSYTQWEFSAHSICPQNSGFTQIRGVYVSEYECYIDVYYASSSSNYLTIAIEASDGVEDLAPSLVSSAGGTATSMSFTDGITTNHNVVATGNVTAGSDRRWKDNIDYSIKGLEVIKKLCPATWTWKEGHGGGDGAGLIAQDVMGVLPYAVMGGEDSGYTLNYNTFHGFEIKALQELAEEVEGLKAENRELKEQIARLTA